MRFAGRKDVSLSSEKRCTSVIAIPVPSRKELSENMKLPTKLTDDLVLETIFEIRFELRDPGLNAILPGLLFGLVQGQRVEPLPISQMPEAIRAADPNLKHAALQRIICDGYSVGVGYGSVSVICSYPYPGWAVFSKHILLVLDALSSLEFVTNVSRHSLKYINILPSKTIAEAVAKMDIDVRLGDFRLVGENFSLRLELLLAPYTCVVQLHGQAVAKVNNTDRQFEGAIIDIESICDFKTLPVPFAAFLSDARNSIDAIHLTGKQVFFGSLKKQTTTDLGATYE